MPKQLELPRIGAKILEGVANGFDVVEMRWAVSDENVPLPVDTLKQYAKDTYKALQEILNPDMAVEPITYTQPATLELPPSLAIVESSPPSTDGVSV